jgi:hypothetical protein
LGGPELEEKRSRKRVKESNILAVVPGQNNKQVGRNRGHINNAVPQVHYQVAIHLISDIFNLEHIRACMSAPEPHGKLLVGEAESNRQLSERTVDL